MTGALPAAAGIGLRSPHVRHVRSERPAVPWLEVHSENYFADGGPAIAALEDLRADYPISLHGVGMSLGSADPLDRAHIAKLKRLADRIEPALVSEHLCWSGVGGRHFNDLLPLPYTEEALAHVSARVEAIQEALGRKLAVENVSTYLAFADATIPEWEFVAEVARRSGCDLLLDVNNIHVNAVNHGFDAERYLAAIPRDSVAEIHLAGFDASGPLPDRHARRRRRAGRLGALRARDRALRPAADADRMGPRHSRIRGAAERGRDGAVDTRCAPCASLAELQQRFARSLNAPEGAAPEFDVAGAAPPSERMDIYRRAVCANYRKALGATYPVVRGSSANRRSADAVDAFVRAHPSASGDLNDYGDAFGTFLAQHPSTTALPYLPDVARLEWAIDEVNRAADGASRPERFSRRLRRWRRSDCPA